MDWCVPCAIGGAGREIHGYGAGQIRIGREIIAGAALKRVVTNAAGQRIITLAAIQRVVVEAAVLNAAES
jgi:hypothetical protein